MTLLLTPEEVGERTRLSTSVVYRAIRAGELPAFKVRRRLRIREADLDAWIEAGRVEPAEFVAPPVPASRVAPRTGSLRHLAAIEGGG